MGNGVAMFVHRHFLFARFTYVLQGLRYCCDKLMLWCDKVYLEKACPIPEL
jgi:hypothetical protein